VSKATTATVLVIVTLFIQSIAPTSNLDACADSRQSGGASGERGSDKKSGFAQSNDEKLSTYCNPMNLDYAFAPKFHNKPLCHRSTADPACVLYKGKYYLFSTNQEGYWWSSDLLRWYFVRCLFKVNTNGDQVCAPAVWSTGKGLLLLPSFQPETTMPLYLTKHPETGKWKEAVHSFPIKCWDPSLFEDDDRKVYLYWDSSNIYPIYGVELNPKQGFSPKGNPLELLRLAPDKHGWEQFGEDNQHGSMAPFVEGAWMNKFGGRYYLQYAAPGTEWNVYGDGVYVSDYPLGPFVYQEHNPFCWKPTGFIRGAGHGSTFPDIYGNLWHVASMVISVKDTFERRLGLFPTALDSDGVLYTDTAFGDYPHSIPRCKQDPGSNFTGWMLLSYHKKCWSSAPASEQAKQDSVNSNQINKHQVQKDQSKQDQENQVNKEQANKDPVEKDQVGKDQVGKAMLVPDPEKQQAKEPVDNDQHSSPSLAFDENIKTYWSAPDGASGHFLVVDLGHVSNVRSLQVNFADEKTTLYGKQFGKRHRYQIFESSDNEKWNLLVDKSKNNTEVPHDYVELPRPVKTRYLKIVNVEMPTGCFAIADFRVFGNGPDALPLPVTNFAVNRDSKDRRNVRFSWHSVPGAYAYNIRFGVAPEKLYSSMLIYDAVNYEMHSLNVDSKYYFNIQAVAESGLSPVSTTVTVE
jgi:hypothetical protein